MVDVEEKVEYKTQRKSGAERNIDDGANNVKAGAKPMGKKMADPGRDLEPEYNVEKVKEELD